MPQMNAKGNSISRKNVYSESNTLSSETAQIQNILCLREMKQKIDYIYYYYYC